VIYSFSVVRPKQRGTNDNADKRPRAAYNDRNAHGAMKQTPQRSLSSHSSDKREDEPSEKRKEDGSIIS
jgi:hypothetical protein